MEKEIIQRKIKWSTMKNLLHFKVSYDEDADTLVLKSTKNKPAISIDCDGDYWIRIDPKTGEILGVEIEAFKAVFLVKHPSIHFPELEKDTDYVKPIADYINLEKCLV